MLFGCFQTAKRINDHHAQTVSEPRNDKFSRRGIFWMLVPVDNLANMVNGVAQN